MHVRGRAVAGRAIPHLRRDVAVGGVAALLALCLVVPVESRSGAVVKWTALAGCLAFLLVFPIGRSDSTLLDLGLFAVFAIVCIGTNLVHGFAGKITLAQAAFLGIGAYVSILLDTGREVSVFGATTLPNLPFLATIGIGGMACMMISLLVGFPALRVQGPWLAFVTLAFNLLVFLVLNNEEGLTGGSRGIRIPRSDLTVFGVDLFDSRNYYYFCLMFMLAATVLVWWIVRSPWGRAFRALRDNPARAASLGVDIRTYTLLAFSISAGLAGVAGALYARLIEYVDPTRLLHRSVLRLLPRHGRRRAGHVGRTVHRHVVHHGADRSTPHRWRLLPRLVRAVRRRDDDRCAEGDRRIVQRTASVVAKQRQNRHAGGAAGETTPEPPAGGPGAGAPVNVVETPWCRYATSPSPSGASTPSTTCPSTCVRARSWASSVPTDAARRRCSTASSASIALSRAPSSCTAMTSSRGRRTGGPGLGWLARSSSSRCSSR